MNIHHHVHRSPLMDPVLSHFNPVHSFTPSFCKIHFKIILPSMPRPPKCSVPLRLPDQSIIYISFFTCTTCPAQLILFDVTALTMLGKLKSVIPVIKYRSVKTYLLLNCALCDENMWMSGSIAPHILNLSIRWIFVPWSL